MTDKPPTQHADDADEAIRAINHLTMSPRDNWAPGDVYDLIGPLAQMAAKLPQALEQASQLIDQLNEKGRLRSDNNQLHYNVAEVFYGLETARLAAQRLHGALHQAHNGLGHIGLQA